MIVITAPTGNIGRQVLSTILAQGERVRVIVRDAARLSAEVRQRVEIFEGSHQDAKVVDAALDGADAVFWLVPADRQAASVVAAYVDFSRPAVEAFRRYGVGRVVGISALGRGFPGNAGYVTASLAMDDLIASSGVAYRSLVMPTFMDNLLWQVSAIKNQGVISSPRPGHLKAPTCANRDIAAVAARLLLDRSWTGNASVPILGPEDLSFQEMAAIMSEVLGRPMRYEETPFDAFRAQLVQFGYSEPMAQGMLDMASAKNRGLDNLEPRTQQGTTPTTFRQWCQEILKPAVEKA